MGIWINQPLICSVNHNMGGDAVEKIVRTKEVRHDSNIATQEAHIYVTRMNDARDWICDWSRSTYDEFMWSKYQIKETDHRTKTATFTTHNPIDLTTGSYHVLITSPLHEDFGGVILKSEYDPKTELYTYTCQDGTRFYLDNVDMVNRGDCTIYDMLRDILTMGNLPVNKKPTKKDLDGWKYELAGLHPLKEYDKFCGNLMRLKPQMIIKNKKSIDIVRALCSGEGSNVDIFFDKYGILHIDPYNADDFFKTGLHLQSRELSDAKFTFDTTNVITNVQVENSDKTAFNVDFGASELIGLSLAVFFGKGLGATVKNPYESTLTKTTMVNGDKTSNDAINTDNPYGTKRKAVEISTDNIGTSKSDWAFMNKVASLLEKNGWKVTYKVRDSNGHSESFLKIKDGVHLIIVGGTDAGVIREQTMESSYVKIQRKLHSRTVWILRWKPGLLDIIGDEDDRKWIPRAHDDNYSPRNFKGLKNPVDRLIKYKIPWITIKDDKPETAVAKFLKGGDIPEAL